MIDKILEIIERDGELIYSQARITPELCMYLYIEENIITEIISTNNSIIMYKGEEE